MSELPATIDLGPLGAGVQVLEGPTRAGNERRWRVRLADGREAMLAALVDELARDDSLRRRYRRDVERMASLALPEVAPLLAWGPAHDEGPPWRLRPQPQGPSLDAWLATRAPAPADEVAALLAALCDRLALLHERGLVVGDLAPAKVVVSDAGPVFVDIGLARVDILSTRTAASLVLEGSPYVAPELLARTAVDGRADLYGVGVIAFRALTGVLPFADTHALLRTPGPAPHPRALEPSLPASLDELVVALLASEPSDRPASARLVAAVLRGQASLATSIVARPSCQSCGAAMPLGQRLCTACGKLAVQFEHAGSAIAPRDRVKLVLRKLEEDADAMAALHRVSAELCEDEVPALNFLLGDARMYSEDERKRRIPLPCTLFTDLDRDTATRIQARYAAEGITVQIVAFDRFDRGEVSSALTRNQRRSTAVIGLASAVFIAAFAFIGVPAMVLIPLVLATVFLLGILVMVGFPRANQRRLAQWGRSLMRLRAGPIALPASDPLVARLAALIRAKPAADVRELLSSLALIVQRLVDHRARNPGEAAQIDMTTEPVAALIERIEQRVGRIAAIDAELRELDEGRLVRALAAARARDEPESARAQLLRGLDRLRELEVHRAQSFGALLEAGDLMRRAVELGLAVHDGEREHERQVRAALLALGPGEPEPSD